MNSTTGNKGKRRVVFEIKAPSGSDVQLAGSFNNWNPEKHPMKYESGVYRKTVMLPGGRHEYKFVIDGFWCVDPECKEWCPDGHGALNSVLTTE